MANKRFGVKEINLVGAAGTPTIESPNNLNIKATNVAISTDMSVGGIVIIGTGATISSPAANTLTLGTNSVERVRITSSGNIGIGTDNPETNFQVRKAIESEIRATENVSGHYVSLYQQAVNSYIIAGKSSGTATQDLLFYTGGSEKVRITSDGEVLKTSQPMMQVYAITTASKTVSGNSTTDLIPLNAANTYDPLSDLDLNTGVYTIPVTGRYLVFYGTEGKTGAHASAGSIYYNVNNGGIAGQCLYYGDAYSGNSKQVILSLAAGDTIKWQIYGNNNNGYTINAAVYGIHLLG